MKDILGPMDKALLIKTRDSRFHSQWDLVRIMIVVCKIRVINKDVALIQRIEKPQDSDHITYLDFNCSTYYKSIHLYKDTIAIPITINGPICEPIHLYKDTINDSICDSFQQNYHVCLIHYSHDVDYDKSTKYYKSNTCSLVGDKHLQSVFWYQQNLLLFSQHPYSSQY